MLQPLNELIYLGPSLYDYNSLIESCKLFLVYVVQMRLGEDKDIQENGGLSLRANVN